MGELWRGILIKKAKLQKKTRTCQKAFPKANNPLPTIDFRGKLAVFREGILINKAKVQIQKAIFETGYIWKVTIYYCIGDTPIFHKHHLYTIGDYG